MDWDNMYRRAYELGFDSDTCGSIANECLSQSDSPSSDFFLYTCIKEMASKIRELEDQVKCMKQEKKS